MPYYLLQVVFKKDFAEQKEKSLLFMAEFV